MATEDTGRKQAKERGFQRTPSCQHLHLKISSLQDCEEVESLFLLLLNLFFKKNLFWAALGLGYCECVFLWLWCTGFSLQCLLLLRSTASSNWSTQASEVEAPRHSRTGSAFAVNRLICSAACGSKFPDQGWNPHPLPWQILNHWTTREVSRKWNFCGWSHPTVVLGVTVLTNLR